MHIQIEFNEIKCISLRNEDNREKRPIIKLNDSFFVVFLLLLSFLFCFVQLIIYTFIYSKNATHNSAYFE